MQQRKKKQKTIEQDPIKNATTKVEQGRPTFRFDTFGDQVFWGEATR